MKLFSCVVMVMLLLTGTCYAGDAGIAEVPQRVVVGAGNVVSSAVAPVVSAGNSNTFNPCGGCAYAPYEVKVTYTPIQPQPGECTYCAVLPYGCPDGSPYVEGICGNPSSCNPCCYNCCPGFIDSCGCAIGVVLSAPFTVIGDVFNCFSCNKCPGVAPPACPSCN